MYLQVQVLSQKYSKLGCINFSSPDTGIQTAEDLGQSAGQAVGPIQDIIVG